MATRLRNPFKLTVGTADVEYDFDPAVVPLNSKVTVILYADAANTNVVYASAGESVSTSENPDISASGSIEVSIENGTRNLHLKGGAASQVIRGTVIGL
jgi:hypothetical protein